MTNEKQLPYGNFGADEIEDARVLNISGKYEPQVKIKGVWCVYNKYERAWTWSTSHSLRFWRERKARAFIESNLVSMLNPMGDVNDEGVSKSSSRK